MNHTTSGATQCEVNQPATENDSQVSESRKSLSPTAQRDGMRSDATENKRRGWDSNPRYPFGAHAISSRVPSATRTPLPRTGPGLRPTQHESCAGFARRRGDYSDHDLSGKGVAVHATFLVARAYQSTTDPSSASYVSGLRQSWLILPASAFSSNSMPSPGPVGRSMYPSRTTNGFLR